MAASFSSNDDFMAEINVTPFVDVMLVLLIIFMVTAPMMTEGLGVDLPKVRSAEALPTEDDHLVLTVKQDGSIFLDTFQTDIASLEALLRNTTAGRRKQLFLKADKDVPYGLVMEVMGHIRASGVDKLGMVAESGNTSESASGGAAADTDAQNSAAGPGI